MRIERGDTYGEIYVLPENVESWKSAIATLREKPGVEDVTIQLIRAVRAQCIGDAELSQHVPQLYWEESLVGQHMFMNERDKPEGERNIGIKQHGLMIMSNAASAAHKYIEEEGMDSLLGASYRFLGRVATYQGDHAKAKELYSKSLSLYQKEEDPLIRVRRLEISAFLSHSMMLTGEVSEGMVFARKTYRDFFDSDDGQLLKDNDYATWAIWASGVPIHISHALKDLGLFDENRDAMQEWLGEAQRILNLPEGVTTWGDEKFQFRRNEITKILG